MSTASSDQAALLPTAFLDKDGGFIINDESVDYFGQAAVPHEQHPQSSLEEDGHFDEDDNDDDSDEEKDTNNISARPGVMAIAWFNRFFSHLGPLLQDPVVYVNMVNAYRDVAGVFAELDRNADARAGAIDPPPPMEYFANFFEEDQLSDMKEHATSCAAAMVMVVNHEIGHLQRQLGLIAPAIEGWVMKAIAALQRTRAILLKNGFMSIEEARDRNPPSTDDPAVIGDRARKAAGEQGQKLNKWKPASQPKKRKEPKNKDVKEPDGKKRKLSESVDGRQKKRPKYGRPHHTLQAPVVKLPIVRKGEKKPHALIALHEISDGELLEDEGTEDETTEDEMMEDELEE